jgi:hypothetical protein
MPLPVAEAFVQPVVEIARGRRVEGLAIRPAREGIADRVGRQVDPVGVDPGDGQEEGRDEPATLDRPDSVEDPPRERDRDDGGQEVEELLEGEGLGRPDGRLERRGDEEEEGETERVEQEPPREVRRAARCVVRRTLPAGRGLPLDQRHRVADP